MKPIPRINEDYTFQKRGLAPLLILSILLIGGTGCAVLTSSQVKEVERFATAVEGYGTLPGTVISAYGEASEEDKLMVVTGFAFSRDDPAAADDALDILQSARKRRQEFNAVARQADDALRVLDTYAELLVTLTSDDFTAILEERALSLGKSLDKTIKTYNEIYATDLSLLGSKAAQAIRGLGGLYIRRRQTVLLKEYVTRAQPIIDDLTKQVENMIDTKIRPHLKDLRMRIDDEFINLANESRRLDLPAVTNINTIFYKLEGAENLADAAISSAY